MASELREENQILRSMLPTSVSMSKGAIADLSREAMALREKSRLLEQERDLRGLESSRLRSERDRLREDISRLYSDYSALRRSIRGLRSTLTILPVRVDVDESRTKLVTTLDAILNAHLTLDGNLRIEGDPLIMKLEGTLKEAERIVQEAEKEGPKDYSFRFLSRRRPYWAELFSSKKITIEIEEGKQTGKGWQYVQIRGDFKPTLSPVDGLMIEQKPGSGGRHLECKILPKKTGSYVLNFEVAGAATRSITRPLEVKWGGWRLFYRFVWWLCTNYLFWLGGILMALIGHADKILTFLKNWREARRTKSPIAIEG